jgi:mRNA interferase RelE/StbE
MPYRVDIKNSAKSEIARLPRNLQRRVIEHIEYLADNPRLIGSKKLAGQNNLYRLRVSDIRIIYSIYDDVLVVLIVKVAHRRDAYD